MERRVGRHAPASSKSVAPRCTEAPCLYPGVLARWAGPFTTDWERRVGRRAQAAGWRISLMWDQTRRRSSGCSALSLKPMCAIASPASAVAAPSQAERRGLPGQVYKIPPRQTSQGHRAADWNGNHLWTGRCRVVGKGEVCTIKLEDPQTGNLFAACPVGPRTHTCPLPSNPSYTTEKSLWCR